MLNINSGNWKRIRKVRLDYFPEHLNKFEQAARNRSDYYNLLKIRINRLCDERYIDRDILF